MKNLTLDFGSGATGPIVLDVETQRLAEQVDGGWSAVHRFGVAVAVTWDKQNGMRVWHEPDIPRLLAELDRFAKVVTFNGENFDFKVLSAYGPVDALYKKSADMLVALREKLGFRVKLESVAVATLKRGKTASGTQSVDWWQSGDPVLRQKVVEYCKQDVEITRDIYLFGRNHGYVMIEDRRSGARRVEVAW